MERRRQRRRAGNGRLATGYWLLATGLRCPSAPTCIASCQFACCLLPVSGARNSSTGRLAGPGASRLAAVLLGTEAAGRGADSTARVAADLAGGADLLAAADALGGRRPAFTSGAVAPADGGADVARATSGRAGAVPRLGGADLLGPALLGGGAGYWLRGRGEWTGEPPGGRHGRIGRDPEGRRRTGGSLHRRELDPGAGFRAPWLARLGGCRARGRDGRGEKGDADCLRCHVVFHLIFPPGWRLVFHRAERTRTMRRGGWEPVWTMTCTTLPIGPRSR
jgi:hypothetical protein